MVARSSSRRGQTFTPPESVHIRLDRQQHIQLQMLAQARGVSMSAVARWAFEHWIQAGAPTPSTAHIVTEAAS